MTSSQRVIINTGSQYLKTIINMVLSLYIVRIVLQALGAEDFGIYSLIAGVIAMLSFLTNAMIATTQRFVSYYQGKGDINQLKRVFNNSLCIHIFIGSLTVLILECITPLLFNGFLNIPIQRQHAATFVYQITVLIILLTFSSSPFRALLVSHENIVYISIVDVLDGLIKLILATFITVVPFDKLKYYSLIMLSVQIFNLLALSLYCYFKYPETTLPNPTKLNKKYLQELGSFAGWTLYSTGCIICRQQGIAVVINKVMGATINAAYGIGFQVAGYTNFLAQSLVNAITPQIVKSEAAGNRKKALWLSCLTCKFIFYLLSMLCIPCMFEIDFILDIWLDDVPQYTSLFCTMVILTLLADAISIGLTYINQAIGNIKWYTILIYTPKLLTLPLFYICIYKFNDLRIAATIYVMIELACAIIRIPFLNKTAGLNVLDFIRQVILREFTPLVFFVGSCWIINIYINPSLVRVIISFVCTNAIFLLAIWVWGLEKQEKDIIKALVFKKAKHD